ncbi:alanine racemase [Pelagimonas varians]|uniref:alanine racemase n=1 Tax=Pelagimonas varians TaxID=696760 RepID=A0A238K7L9_9RHOB|nr:alanine racemase [Pelagimonas varians]PYG31913.1 alanine racemase [Pelagimonas varians]SMX38444.1 Alanine racemase [Pelagimonas varians]
MGDTLTESSWCEISRSKLEQNLDAVIGLMPADTLLCAVVKGDAYGHGIENVVPLLINRNISHIGISSNAEARAVRAAGFQGRVLRLRSATPYEVRSAIGDRVEELVGSQLSLEQLIKTLGAAALPNLHLSLNAGGMSRDGLELSTGFGRTELQKMVALAPDKIIGLCTHFPSNAAEDLAASIARFHQDCDWVFTNTSLTRANVLTHAGSTLTLRAQQDPKTDMMRCGAILYGIKGPRPAFQSALALKARVISIGHYPEGSSVGYDRSCRLQENKVLASIALGYANGYSRLFSGRGAVLIGGQKVPVLGKVSMNTIVADITSVPAVAIGDEVVAFGHQGDQSIGSSEIEEITSSIMADVFTDWGQRNARVARQS